MSYVTDPPWQRKFSIIWPSVLTFFVVISLLHLVRSIRNGRAYTTLLGVSEGVYCMRRRGALRTAENWIDVVGWVFWWMLPGLGLNAGQSTSTIYISLASTHHCIGCCLVGINVGYIATVIACIVVDAPLVSNSNRVGTAL